MFCTVALLILSAISHGEGKQEQYPTSYTPFSPVHYPEDYCENFDENEKWDFVIVGAGPAGCTLSRRLAEDPSIRVLLLEAGGRPTTNTDIPINRYSVPADKIWHFHSVEGEGLCEPLDGPGCPINPGKMLGGSSNINELMYVRGNHRDYDGWAELGCTGWSYKDVLPYFKKQENYTVYPLVSDKKAKHSKGEKVASNKYHGTSGPLYQSKFPVDPKTHQFREALKKATVQHGIKFNLDVNGEDQIGITELGGMIDPSGYRDNAAKAYLRNIPDNLKVCMHSLAMKIVLKGKKAVGVDFKYNGTGEVKNYRVKAEKEIIISAGALHSPALLERSGIGRKEVLEKVGVKLLHELRGVGENYQDHYLCHLKFEVDFLSAAEVNPLSNDLLDLCTFYNTTDLSSKVSNVQVFAKVYTAQLAEELPKELRDQVDDVLKTGRNIMMYVPIHLRHTKPGSIHITQTEDPTISPEIVTNFLSTEREQKVLIDAARLTRKIMGSDIMKKFKPTPFVLKNCQKHKYNTADEILCQMRSIAKSLYHQSGVNAMGPRDNPKSVVDPDLKVIGLKGLRIIDSSVMPMVTRGNTQIPTIMVAEKGADIVKKAWNIKN